MKLEVGKTYKTRCGDIVRIHRIGHPNPADNGTEFYEFSGEHDQTGLQGWRGDGRFTGHGESMFDLVEEVVTWAETTPEPVTSWPSTLSVNVSELKPGDTMRLITVDYAVIAALRSLIREVDGLEDWAPPHARQALIDAADIARSLVRRYSQ